MMALNKLVGLDLLEHHFEGAAVEQADDRCAVLSGFVNGVHLEHAESVGESLDDLGVEVGNVLVLHGIGWYCVRLSNRTR